MEKTFNELLIDCYPQLKEGRRPLEQKVFDAYDMLDFALMVRDITIKECEKYVDNNPEIVFDFTRGREIKFNLLTDRIKVKEE